MKNALKITTRYNRLESLTFIQRFATAYMHLEASAGKPDIYGYCAECRPDCKKPNCEKDEAGADAIRCKFFFLFNTMCGNSAIRGHFDGKPSEAQKLVGDTAEESHGCGSEYVVDFLFGYTGYEYRKVTGDFNAEIIAAIDAGKPVIAKVKSGGPRFYLINGYNGDALICPDFINKWNFLKNRPEEAGPDGPPSYDDLDVLYIFGDKTARRYTLIDGLHNICRTMECNINEHVLDGYLKQMGEGFIKASRKERAARLLLLHDTVLYLFNIVSFMGAFVSDPNPHSHYLHQKIWAIPDFAELSNRLNEQHWIILNNGHKISDLTNRLKKAAFTPWKIRSLSADVCGAIREIKEADMKLLEIINQAIAILEEGTK